MSSRRVTRATAATVLVLGCVAAQGLTPADAEALPAPATRVANGGPAHGGTLSLLGMGDVINLDTVSVLLPGELRAGAHVRPPAVQLPGLLELRQMSSQLPLTSPLSSRPPRTAAYPEGARLTPST